MFSPHKAPSRALNSSLLRSPLTSTSPASEYWGIDQSITYGSETILASTAGIVDTGTTLVLIASGESMRFCERPPRVLIV